MTTLFSTFKICLRIALGLAVSIGLQVSFAWAGESPLSSDQREVRLQHAHELMGKYYTGSVARVGENVKKINSSIYHWTKDRLPKSYRKQYQQVAQTIIDESLKYEFDPVFLMSVIQSESSFHPERVGGVGEIGLMQIRPETGQWIAKKFELGWHGKKTLFDPVANIRIGAAYLSYLRDHFDMHARLYLAAYNMGQGNVTSAREKNIWPKDYPIQVMKNYVDFYTTLKEKEKRVSLTSEKG